MMLLSNKAKKNKYVAMQWNRCNKLSYLIVISTSEISGATCSLTLFCVNGWRPQKLTETHAKMQNILSFTKMIFIGTSNDNIPLEVQLLGPEKQEIKGHYQHVITKRRTEIFHIRKMWLFSYTCKYLTGKWKYFF